MKNKKHEKSLINLMMLIRIRINIIRLINDFFDLKPNDLNKSIAKVEALAIKRKQNMGDFTKKRMLESISTSKCEKQQKQRKYVKETSMSETLLLMIV
jgi:hypothetical protein